MPVSERQWSAEIPPEEAEGVSECWSERGGDRLTLVDGTGPNNLEVGLGEVEEKGGLLRLSRVRLGEVLADVAVHRRVSGGEIG